MTGTKENKKNGIVYICGAGPGDPKLITVRCLELIETCDIVLYDRLVSDEIISLIPKSIDRIYVGRESGDPTTNQIKTNELMVYHALNGKKVLRLKGGDPFIFGRGGEEAQILVENSIPFEIIPGISSAIGSAVYSGIPLTYRNISSSVALITGHEDPTKEKKYVNWSKLANAVDTIVILMGLENLSNIIKELKKGGMPIDTPIAIIQKGTTNQQRIFTAIINDDICQIIEKNNIRPPSVIIIGKVVNLSKEISWFISQ